MLLAICRREGPSRPRDLIRSKKECGEFEEKRKDLGDWSTVNTKGDSDR